MPATSRQRESSASSDPLFSRPTPDDDHDKLVPDVFQRVECRVVDSCAPHLLEKNWIVSGGSEREEKTAEVIVYTVGELAELFGEARFSVDWLAKEPFHVGAPGLLFVGR